MELYPPKTGPKVKEKIEAEIIESEAKLQGDPQFYHGWDWWHLSEEEEFVFDIKLERWSRMEGEEE
jgi:hypothetical protein